MKKIYYYILMFITILVVYITLKKDFLLIINQISNINILYFLLALLLVVIFWLGKGLLLFYNTHNFKPNFKFFKAFEIVLKTQFFDDVTPFASGGQPFEIYLLNKEKISIPKSTGIIVSNTLIYQISRTILCLIAVIINLIYEFVPIKSTIFLLALLGIFLNFLLTIIYILFLFNKKFSKNITKLIYKILNKFRKNKYNKEELEESFTNYRQVSKYIKENKKKFYILILLNLIIFIPLYLIPYVLFKGVGYSNINLIAVFFMCVLSSVAASFIPAPGSTGGSEYFFLKFMGHIVSYSASSVMLLWRFITYYLSILTGAILLNKKSKN